MPAPTLSTPVRRLRVPPAVFMMTGVINSGIIVIPAPAIWTKKSSLDAITIAPASLETLNTKATAGNMARRTMNNFIHLRNRFSVFGSRNATNANGATTTSSTISACRRTNTITTVKTANRAATRIGAKVANPSQRPPLAAAPPTISAAAPPDTTRVTRLPHILPISLCPPCHEVSPTLAPLMPEDISENKPLIPDPTILDTSTAIALMINDAFTRIAEMIKRGSIFLMP